MMIMNRGRGNCDMAQQQKADPSPQQIAERCAEIQRGWTTAERMRRLRSDLRPQVRCADGRREAVTADDYTGHLARGQQ